MPNWPGWNCTAACKRGRASPSRPEAAGSPTSRVILRAAVEHFRALGGRTVSGAGHGQPRRRHGRRPAASAGVVRHHRGSGRLPDPCEHGNRDRRPGRRRVSPAHRPRGLPGRSRAGLRPRETPYLVGRRLPKRTLEDALDRAGQADRGQHLSPRHRRLRLRPDRAQRGPRGPAEVPRRGGAGDRGKRLRRNGPDRGGRTVAVRSPRDRSCSPWPGSGWPACRSTRSTCW